jgi:hypothetical protein
MQDKIQKQILDAFFVVLRPIAKILLRYGIGFREFAEVAKSAFVDVASTEYGIRGRPTNMSRVAVMTGLTRKEVRRLRDQLALGEVLVSRKYTPLGRILHRWHSETDFLDEHGRPAALPFAGDRASFSELVRRYAGDIPPGAIRTELKRVAAIVEDESGKLRVIRRDVHAETGHENVSLSLLHGAYALLENIAHNNDPGRNEPTWAQMTAFTGDIRKVDLVRVRRICADRAREAAESYDDLFSGFEQREDSVTGQFECLPVAMGVFYFEERDKKLGHIWKNT